MYQDLFSKPLELELLSSGSCLKSATCTLWKESLTSTNNASMPYCQLVDNKCIKERCKFPKHWFVCPHVRHALRKRCTKFLTLLNWRASDYTRGCK
jgi:hypothetical protein